MSGAFMQVIQVEAFTSLDSYQHGVRAFLDGMRETPPAPGFDEVMAPGDRGASPPHRAISQWH